MRNSAEQGFHGALVRRTDHIANRALPQHGLPICTCPDSASFRLILQCNLKPRAAPATKRHKKSALTITKQAHFWLRDFINPLAILVRRVKDGSVNHLVRVGPESNASPDKPGRVLPKGHDGKFLAVAKV